MSWLRLLAFLAFGLNIVLSQDADRVITELETKTSTAHNAGMGGGGHIRVAVYTPEGICLTEILDSPQCWNGRRWPYQSGGLHSRGDLFDRDTRLSTMLEWAEVAISEWRSTLQRGSV